MTVLLPIILKGVAHFMYFFIRDEDNQKNCIISLKGDALGKQYKCPETAAKLQYSLLL